MQLAVSPADGFEFVGWQGEGCATFTMTAARTCTAMFEEWPPTCDADGCLQADYRAQGGHWDEALCSCQYNWEDPLVLTLDGSPIRLTALSAGVSFDVDGDGVREPIAWTRAGSRAAFLALDLDSDGAITTGAELFGVPVGATRRHRPAAGENSFTLLAAYDAPANGGNGDGAISAADAVFSRLRLWIDANHDGVSQPGELMPLSTAGVESIELAYQVRGRRDGQGNFYRYRGVVHLTSGRHVPIWDVFLATGGGAGSDPAEDGVMPPDGRDGATAQSQESAGGVAGEDRDSIATAAAGLPDDPPPILQVVEYYHLDVVGSVRAVTDAQGQVLRRHDFQPFGEELNAQFPPHDRKLFTGQERDFETGLDYFHARQLRTDLGRFTAPDPLTDLAWTDPTRGASSTYGYVWNNPVGFIDPMGAEGDQASEGAGYWFCDAISWAPCAWMPEHPAIFRSGVVADTWYQDLYMQPDYSFGGGGGSYQSNGGAGSVAGKGGTTTVQTKKNIACTADALLNFGASTLIPGYAAAKTILAALDVNVNPVQWALGYNQPVTAAPTVASIAVGASSMNWLYREAAFDAAGGATTLDRLQALASRTFSGAANSAKYGAEITALGGLSRAATFAGRLTGVLSAVSAGVDIYNCWAGK